VRVRAAAHHPAIAVGFDCELQPANQPPERDSPRDQHQRHRAAKQEIGVARPAMFILVQ
jgi:hypothetical protein